MQTLTDLFSKISQNVLERREGVGEKWKFCYVPNRSKSQSMVGGKMAREKWNVLPICSEWIKVTELGRGGGGAEVKMKNFTDIPKMHQSRRAWEGEGK